MATRDNGQPAPKKPSLLQRQIEQAIGHDSVFGRPDDPAIEKFPLLWQWLTTVDAGKLYVKSPATLTIRVGPEGVLATVNDRDLATALDATCPYLEGVFAALEQALAGDNPAMRRVGKGEVKIRKRKSQ